MSGRALMAAVVLVAAAAPTVRADDRKDAETLFRVGEKAFDATQYGTAADLFEQAYGKLPLPAIAFSLAQAQRLQYFVDHQPQRLHRAVELYRLYIGQQKQGGRVGDAVANLAQIEPMLRDLDRGGAAGVAAPAPVRSTRLVVMADVAGAQATIDGATGPVPFVQEVTPGSHAITVSAEGYEPLARTASAIDGELVPVELQLVAKPGRLSVAGPAGATVTVDSRAVGAAPLVGLAVAPGRHLIAVADRGREPFVREVDVARGAQLALAPTLHATRQRRAVPWLVVGGGGLAIGAGVAAVLAHSAATDADAAHALLAAGGASADVVTRYDRDLSDRQSRLQAAEWLGAGAGAVLATAALLYVFDHPTVEAPPAVVPLASPTAVGAAVRGSF